MNVQGNVYVWKIRQGNDLVDLQPVTMFNAHPKYLTRCLLSPDSKLLATCSADTTVKIWSTENYNYKLERVLSGHQRWVWDAAFSADSAYLVTASSDHVARLWDLHSGATVRQYSGHHRYVYIDELSQSSTRLSRTILFLQGGRVLCFERHQSQLEDSNRTTISALRLCRDGHCNDTTSSCVNQ
jgi:WD40 repeat protein